jgi:hypothetical protein
MTGTSSGVRSWASVKRDRWASAFEQSEWPGRVARCLSHQTRSLSWLGTVVGRIAVEI